ncbi:MAG: hypothetical protein UU47_C0032G0002 [candidate division TM6 bacterium GW2011_GWE2_41_16]|nr:MAG: hypothetical protein UU47_C0032G0002 [candidate division TM6 bacterium GW2011_GWE2_41_16]
MFDLFISFFLLASAITANKIAVAYIDPLWFATLRMGTAAIMLALISFVYACLFHKETARQFFGRFKTALRAHTTLIIFMSIAIMSIPPICKAYALKHMLSAKVAAFGSIDPFVTAIIAYILWHEKLSIKKWLGITCALAGTTVLIISNSPLEKLMGSLCYFSYPELAMLAAVIIGRMGWIGAQFFMKKSILSALELNSLLMTFGAFASGVWALTFSPNTIWTSCSSHLPFMLAFTYTVIIGNIFAYTMYTAVLKHYSATLISLTSLSVPLWVSLFGFVLLSEHPSWHFFTAIGLFALGLALFYRLPGQQNTQSKGLSD